MDEVTHRPWPIISKNWIMRQSWSNVLFTHWPISAELLRPHIPRSLEIDTFDGTAWLGVVVFIMEGIYLRGLTALSVTPKFAEVNVRTYVQRNGKPGVYFMSLDVGDLASLMIAKRWYRLPYKAAQISLQKEDQTFLCKSLRKEKSNVPIGFHANYIPLSGVYLSKKELFDDWLTERYCFFSTDKRANIYCGEIHHQPWPLQKVDIEICKNSLFTPFQFDLSEEKMIAHFSKGLDSLFWNIKRLDW
jgi:uncharacterized protein YqjF (DUF2071 family)